MRRRQYLLAAGAAVGLAGCGAADDEEGETTERTTQTETATTTTEARTATTTEPTTTATATQTTTTATETDTETQTTTTATETGAPRLEVAGDWPQPKGNPRNTAYAPEIESPTSPEIAWSTEFKDARPRAHSVSDGVVYVNAGDHLHAVDAATGEKNWSFEVEWRHTTPVATGDSVYILTNGGVRAIDTGTATHRWDFGVHPKPGWMTYAEGTLFVGTGATDGQSGVVYAVTEDGNQTWEFQTPGDRDSGAYPIAGRPGVGEGKVFFGAQRVYGLDPATGTKEWSTSLAKETDDPTRAYATTGAVVTGGVVCIGYYQLTRRRSGDHIETGVAVLSAADGTIRRRIEMPSEVRVSPAVTESAIHVIDRDGHFRSFDRVSGTKRWGFNVEHGRVTPAVSHEIVHVVSGQTIYARDAATGKLRWSRSIGTNDASPSPVDGIVYHTHGSKLSALTDPRSG